MGEIAIFQGVALIIFASLPAVGWFLKIARSLERESETIVNEKASIIDEYFFRSTSAVTSKIVYRILGALGQVQTEGGTILDTIKTQMGPYIDEMLKLSPKQIEEQIYSAELPPELLSLCRISDEDKDRLISISFLASQLKENIPQIFSSMVDRMIKGIISGIACGIFIALLDLLVNLNLMQYFGIMTAFALLAGFFYFNYGILSIWTLRKFEKKLKGLEKEKEINSIWKTVMEMSKYE